MMMMLMLDATCPCHPRAIDKLPGERKRRAKERDKVLVPWLLSHFDLRTNFLAESKLLVTVSTKCVSVVCVCLVHFLSLFLLKMEAKVKVSPRARAREYFLSRKTLFVNFKYGSLTGYHSAFTLVKLN